MGILARAVAEQKSAVMGSDSLLQMLISAGLASKAGPAVNLTNTFKVAAAFACLKVLSQGCAQVPFKLFQESTQGGLTKILPARDQPLYDLLTVKPNDWTTSFEFRETIVLHAALGNAYVFKNKVRGKIVELIPLQPGWVRKVQKPDYTITYQVTSPQTGAQQDFPADAIWHIKGPSWDGVLGMDVLNLAREALGLSIATEESQARLHKRGVQPSGVYSVDGTLGPGQYKDLKDWITREHAGADNAGAVMVLDRNAKFISSAMTGVDAQHLETRKHQVEEVCRFFGVFPTMVFQTDKTSTFASAEAFFEAHVRYSLVPWFTRIEQSADAFLLTPAERATGLYFKFMAAGLLRGNAADRANYYAKALGSGGSQAWMTADEVRELEELNPLGGDAAKLPAVTNAPKPAAIPA